MKTKLTLRHCAAALSLAAYLSPAAAGNIMCPNASLDAPDQLPSLADALPLDSYPVFASLYAGKPSEEHNFNPKIIKDQPIYAVAHYYVLTPQRVQALQPTHTDPFQLRVNSKGPDLPTAEPNIVAGKSKGANALWLMPVILGAADADDVRKRISDMMRVGVLTPKIQARANYASLHMHKLNVFPCGFALPLFHTQKESDFEYKVRGATAEDDPFIAIIRKPSSTNAPNPAPTALARHS